jgi:tetratricopeptide (TPR) repeat protein
MSIKRLLSWVGVALLLFSGLVQAQAPLQKPLADFDKLVSQLKVSTVVGEPIRVGETTVIPFARVSFGMGAGGATLGLGGGMGGKTVPLGVLVVEGDDVRAELFPEEEKGASFFDELRKFLPEKVIIGNAINIAGSRGVFEEMLPVLPELMKGMEIIGNGVNVAGSNAPESPARGTGAAAGGKGEAKPAGTPKPTSMAEMQNLFKEKKYQEALAMADVLLTKDPTSADLHAWKGHIMGSMAQGSPLDIIKYGMGAMQEYEKALALDPNNADAHLGRAIGRLSAPPGFGGDIDGAITDLEMAIGKKPSPEAYYYLGEAFRRKGLSEEAREAYGQALKLRPDFAEAKKALDELK